MIQTFNTGLIESNSKHIIKGINGHILKITFKRPKGAANIRVILTSEDGEKIIDDTLIEEITYFYPRRLINITQEFTHVEKYPIAEDLILEIEGMAENDSIFGYVYYK